MKAVGPVGQNHLVCHGVWGWQTSGSRCQGGEVGSVLHWWKRQPTWCCSIDAGGLQGLFRWCRGQGEPGTALLMEEAGWVKHPLANMAGQARCSIHREGRPGAQLM